MNRERPLPLTRRRFLGGAVAGIATGAGYTLAAQRGIDLPGGRRIRVKLGACGSDPGVPDVPGPELVRGLLPAGFLDQPSEWIVSYPPGMTGTNLPVVVVLHGVQGEASHAFDDNHGLGRFQVQAIENGSPPFALAIVSGFATLWFDRTGGPRPRSLVLDGFLPILTELGLNLDKLALYGWGSGAFGVLGLAAQYGVDRIAAIGSLSPAIFPSWDFVPGFYLDEAEWAANDPEMLIGALEKVPLRIDCGADDPFAAEVRQFRSQLSPVPVGGIEPGCRDFRYWHRQHPVMLDFLAGHLE